MDALTKFEAMVEIIKDLEKLIRPEDTGHIRTAISVLNEQRDALRDHIKKVYRVDNSN